LRCGHDQHKYIPQFACRDSCCPLKPFFITHDVISGILVQPILLRKPTLYLYERTGGFGFTVRIIFFAGSKNFYSVNPLTIVAVVFHNKKIVVGSTHDEYGEDNMKRYGKGLETLAAVVLATTPVLGHEEYDDADQVKTAMAQRADGFGTEARWSSVLAPRSRGWLGRG
jgi:hypothetical protein